MSESNLDLYSLGKEYARRLDAKDKRIDNLELQHGLNTTLQKQLQADLAKSKERIKELSDKLFIVENVKLSQVECENCASKRERIKCLEGALRYYATHPTPGHAAPVKP